MQARAASSARLVVVTGKGGVGKSSLAAALAVAAARRGRRTCLIDLEQRQSLAELLGTRPWSSSEREVRSGLFGLSVDADAALAEYLRRFYGPLRLSRLIAGGAALNFATTAAPGLRDVLLLGKVKEVERRGVDRGHPAYDLVVVDAPPTGRITRFLQAPQATAQLVGVGPVRSQAQSIVDLLEDRQRTRIQLVATYEELAVSETIDGARALLELGAQLSPVIVNRVVPPYLDAPARKALGAGLQPAQLRSAVAAAGVRLSAPAAAELRDLGQAHLRQLAAQRGLRRRLLQALRDAGQPSPALRELPDLRTAAVGPAEVDRLARELDQEPR